MWDILCGFLVPTIGVVVVPYANLYSKHRVNSSVILSCCPQLGLGRSLGRLRMMMGLGLGLGLGHSILFFNRVRVALAGISDRARAYKDGW